MCRGGLGLPAQAIRPRPGDPLLRVGEQCDAVVQRPLLPSPTILHLVGRDGAEQRDSDAVGTYTVKCNGVGGGTVGTAAANAAEGAPAPDGGDKASQWGAGGHVQVTAYGGEDADHCKVINWTTGGADFSASVKCYNYKGKLADSRFDLLFVW